VKVANGAINVQQRVACDTQMGFADCAVSETGILAYIKAAPQNDASEEKEVVWMNVEGKTKLAIPDRGAYIAPSLSRSGSKLAVTIEDKDKTRGGSRSHIEILDFARPILQQLTPPAEKPFGPLAVSVWSPDERWVYFNRREDGKWGIFRKRSDFRGEIENVVLRGDALMVPQSFSPDGKLFTYWEAESQSQKSSMMVTEAEGGNKPRPINEEVGRMVAMPEISPGGEWLAYVVQPPGGTAEIYVSPFLRTGALMQVSKGGGTLPRWSPAEKRLFFLSAEEPRIMAVDYTMTTEKTFTATLPREILKIPANIDPVWFGVNTNGREFLVTRTIKPVETSSPGETNNARCVSLVINWFTELEQKVPIRKE
jgi:dipeptidyl aminopeptidase/acylaminoacyl peptidase